MKFSAKENRISWLSSHVPSKVFDADCNFHLSFEWHLKQQKAATWQNLKHWYYLKAEAGSTLWYLVLSPISLLTSGLWNQFHFISLKDTWNWYQFSKHLQIVTWCRWALGVLVYYMLQGELPFGSWRESELEIFGKIINRHMTFPSSFSFDAMDLIDKVPSVHCCCWKPLNKP